MADRPNILLIMSDEHDAAVMGCYGDPLNPTPRLDQLASRGVTFDACYCNSPLCGPSRLSFTAGQYASRCSAWSNNCWLPGNDYPSIARTLNASGYQSYLCGKQHYAPGRRYGFKDIAPGLFTNNYVKTGEVRRRAADNLTPNKKGWLGRSSDFFIGGHDDNEVIAHDQRVRDTAAGFLAGRSPDDAPFFLFTGFLAPHFPLIVPEPYATRFWGRTPDPVIPEGLIENLPLNYKHQRAGFGTVDTDPQVVRKGRDLYWAFTNWFDNLVGSLLDELADTRVADNTIVIYTSDHGENKGDHGMWWKNNLYDHGARVPLIVSWPRRWAGGQRRSGACSLVDLVQTLTDIAHAPTPDNWDGDSLLPWLDNPDYAWKDTALSEYYGHNIASGITMWRHGQWKYVYHCPADEAHPAQRELFNMADDPKELKNLAHDPTYATRIEAMHRAMVSELGEDPDAIEQRCRREGAQPYA